MNRNLHLPIRTGFTLIELLVVIAIIGVLSSVVLASLNSARAKGVDAKIKAQLSGLRAAAELYYSGNVGNNTYGVTTALCSAGMFTDTTVVANINALPTPANAVCGATTVGSPAYAVKYPLGSVSGYWCVDSLGKSEYVAGAIGSSVTVCP
jgi:prepilin-type N-terminal cleavage/methylation domain-containing protein